MLVVTCDCDNMLEEFGDLKSIIVCLKHVPSLQCPEASIEARRILLSTVLCPNPENLM